MTEINNKLKQFSALNPNPENHESRRDFLKLLGFSAVGAVPATTSMATAAIPPLKTKVSKKRIAFILGNTTVWDIDTRRFSGHPTLEVEEQKDRLNVVLQGAYLPGTNLLADMRFEITRKAGDWRLKLLLQQFPGIIDVPFEPWLAGQVTATCSASVEQITTNIGDEFTHIIHSGRFNVQFFPNWKLDLYGEEKLSLVHRGQVYPSRSVQVALVDNSQSHKANNSQTHFLIERDNENWPFGAWLNDDKHGRFVNTNNAFDYLLLESSKSSRNQPGITLYAGQKSSGTSLQFEPGKKLKGYDNKPINLSLRQPILTRRNNVKGEIEVRLSAFFDTQTRQIYRSGCTMLLSDPEVSVESAESSNNQPPFSAIYQDGRLVEMRCEPGLTSVYTSMPDAITKSISLPQGIRLAFAGGAATAIFNPRQSETNSISNTIILKKTTSEVGAISAQAIDSISLKPGSVVLPDLSVSVIRPEDLLAITFQFFNLNLEASNNSVLVKRDAAKPAYIAAVFPPQNIQEEALYESESSADPARSPPLQSRLAGESRLVFLVPKSVSQIPYTLVDLLEACGSYPIRVPYLAQPPPKLLQIRALGLALGNTTSVRQVKSRELKKQGKSLTATLATTANLGDLVVKGPQTGKPPSPLETAIEMPYRLMLSPHNGAAWAHARKPVPGHRNRTELWHTRLGVRTKDGLVDERNDYQRTLRAVWSPDYNREGMPKPGVGPYLASLDARDRHEIVALTSDFRIPDYTPLPVWARRCMLTSLGAWLDCRGQWMPPCDPHASESKQAASIASVGELFRKAPDPCPPGTTAPCSGVALSVEEWRHRATMGRDHYVRVVYKGYLFPFGHRASLIKVTERKFRAVEDGPLEGKPAAYLHQRTFIVVREPVLDFPINDKEDRRNPFRRIAITTEVTPNLDKQELSEIVDGANRQAFWPQVDNQPFLFHLIAEDWRGKSSDYTAPLIFLDQSWAKNIEKVGKAVSEYAASSNEDRRKRSWQGQSIAYAEVKKDQPGSTSLDTLSVTFAGRSLNCLQGDQPAFLPFVERARARIPAVEALTGGQPSDIQISQIYIDNAFGGDNAQGEVFTEILGGNPLNFSSDKSGGVATPNMNIAALSRENGPIGGATGEDGKVDADLLQEFAKGNFDPEKYFEGAVTDAMLLGGIRLFDLLIGGKDDGGGAKLKSKDAPKLTNNPIYENDIPVGVETLLVWEPPVNPIVPVFVADKGGKSKFRLESRVVNRIDGGEPEQYIHGIISNFSVDLIGGVASFLEIEFDKFEFTSTNGSKPDINPQIRDVHFKGPLKYVEQLSKYLSSVSGGDQNSAGGGFNIEVTPGGISAEFGISIPTINSGVLSIQNIAFSGGITVPFSGDPMRARFAFCGQDNPFLLTIYCFGGGGYAVVGIGLDGVEQLEFAFEFGASIALDIGVASGGVEVMAGIYVNVEKDNGCQLTGYLRMGGELNVLAIIRISIEFNMALTHNTKTNQTWGECQLTIEIEILIFSASVSMYVRRDFSEPTLLPFRDMMSPQDWTGYCDSFA